MSENINELLANFKNIKEEFKKNAQESLKQCFKDFFEKQPNINAVHWTQCTPYFNDGDPCYFSINEIYFTNAKDEELENISNGEYIGENKEIFSLCDIDYVLRTDAEWYNEDKELLKKNGIVKSKDFKELVEILNDNEMREILEMTFGEHAYIIATKDGFNVSEYADHD